MGCGRWDETFDRREEFPWGNFHCPICIVMPRQGQRATLLILLTPDQTGPHVFIYMVTKVEKLESGDGRQTEIDSYISCSSAS